MTVDMTKLKQGAQVFIEGGWHEVSRTCTIFDPNSPNYSSEAFRRSFQEPPKSFAVAGDHISVWRDAADIEAIR